MDTKALRQKVLDLAIRGKLVPQDSNDEPASVLLARIRVEKQQMVKDGKLKAKDLKGDSVIFKGEDNLHYEKMPDGTVKCIENEIPFEVPEGWVWTRLCAITQFVSDGDHQPPPQSTSGVPFLVISDVNTGVLNFSNCRFVENSYYDSLPTTRKAQRDDILFTVTGSYGIPVGVKTNMPFCFQRHIALLRPLLVVAEMMTFVLESDFVMDLCHSTATGIAQKTVGLHSIRGFLVPLPPYCEQQRIVNTISSAFAQIDILEKEKTELQTIITQAKSKILDLAIRGKLVSQDPTDEPASVLLERIRTEKESLIKQGKIKREKNESFIFRGDDKSYYEKVGDAVRNIDAEIPFKVPDSWAWVRLSNLGSIVSGGTPKTSNTSFWDDGSIAWITPADLSGHTKKYISSGARSISEKGLLESSAQLMPSGSVLFSSRAPIGYIAIASNKLCTNQGFKSVVPHMLQVNEYIYYYLKAQTSEVQQRASGTTFKEISGNEFGKTVVAFPPLCEQNIMVSAIEDAYIIIATIAENLS